MKAGACRYDTEGYVTEHISQEEEAYAAARLDKIRRQNRIKAELQAVLDENKSLPQGGREIRLKRK
ncbi:Fertility inhibition protein [Escherichia coli]|nr:Fertility inhibition protein [Escherichia coli]